MHSFHRYELHIKYLEGVGCAYFRRIKNSLRTKLEFFREILSWWVENMLAVPLLIRISKPFIFFLKKKCSLRVVCKLGKRMCKTQNMEVCVTF